MSLCIQTPFMLLTVISCTGNMCYLFSYILYMCRFYYNMYMLIIHTYYTCVYIYIYIHIYIYIYIHVSYCHSIFYMVKYGMVCVLYSHTTERTEESKYHCVCFKCHVNDQTHPTPTGHSIRVSVLACTYTICRYIHCSGECK